MIWEGANFQICGVQMMKYPSFTPVPENRGQNCSACRHPWEYSTSCAWWHFILLWSGVLHWKISWQGMWFRFFNIHLEMNLLVRMKWHHVQLVEYLKGCVHALWFQPVVPGTRVKLWCSISQRPKNLTFWTPLKSQPGLQLQYQLPFCVPSDQEIPFQVQVEESESHLNLPKM